MAASDVIPLAGLVTAESNQCKARLHVHVRFMRAGAERTALCTGVAGQQADTMPQQPGETGDFPSRCAVNHCAECVQQIRSVGRSITV